ncbi:MULTISPECIES: hypothetical protein [Roseomonadaceae]|nr:hypothetical protein [Roseomonas oleicola]
MTPAEKLAFEKRRRGRNWALLAALIGLVVLFYFIATVRLMGG